MPNIAPSSPSVSWSPSEGILGVVGVAPWATLEFCRAFYSLVSAEKDWLYPRVILDINPKIPSRGRHLQLGEKDPSPFISQTISELAGAGATLGVVACNTAHIFFERWAVGAPIPILNIVDSTIALASRNGAGKVLSLVSGALAEDGLYHREAAKAGLDSTVLPENLQKTVEALIGQVKTGGQISALADGPLTSILDFLSNEKIDTVLVGCTELSSLASMLRALGIRVIDSNEALGRAAYDAITA